MLLLSFLLIACAGQPVNAQSGDPVFSITQKNPDDQVTVQIENGAAVIDIRSPLGIGWAAFELASGSMPERVTVRLHLSGLEDFRILSGEEEVAASFSSSRMLEVQQRVLSEGHETPIVPAHPLWLDIKIVSDLDEKSIPLQEGYFEITLPEQLIQRTGKSFEVRWIDFYR